METTIQGLGFRGINVGPRSVKGLDLQIYHTHIPNKGLPGVSFVYSIAVAECCLS